MYHNCFVISRDVHSHDTRQRNDLLIRYVKKSFNMKSVQYSGSALWDCLPLMLKEQMSKSHLKIKLNYIYFLKWWQHSYADSSMRLTRHSSDSTAFKAPVNSSQHDVSAAGQLVIRFWAVTSWSCDELTGTLWELMLLNNAPTLLVSVVTVWHFSMSVGVDQCFDENVGGRFGFGVIYVCTKCHCTASIM